MRKTWMLMISVALLLPACNGADSVPVTQGSNQTVKRTPSAYSMLWQFHGRTDGANPYYQLTASNGSFFGSTQEGGGAPNKDCGYHGCGAVFQLSPNTQGKYKISKLYAFHGAADGQAPSSPVVISGSDLIGTTALSGPNGDGTAYELASSGSTYSLASLYAFTGSANDGAAPSGTLARIGSTIYGSSVPDCSKCGLVYALTTTTGTGLAVSPIATFSGTQGYATRSLNNLSGQLYGTNLNGGRVKKICTQGCGTIFTLTPSGDYKVTYTFKGKKDGAEPDSTLWQDSNGNIFGTTMFGGDKVRCGGKGCGVVFEIAAGSTTEKPIYTFEDESDGAYPIAGVVGDGEGNLYGAASSSGQFGYGDLFELSPGRKHTYSVAVLHGFGGTKDAKTPTSTPVLLNGVLYGTLEYGGFGRCPSGCGAVYAYQLQQ
jgi:hypothetical protein